nr:hypothetical protein HmN_000790200 [Hymenolepis microstoma]
MNAVSHTDNRIGQIVMPQNVWSNPTSGDFRGEPRYITGQSCPLGLLQRAVISDLTDDLTTALPLIIAWWFGNCVMSDE